jgi:hypothetical protein
MAKHSRDTPPSFDKEGVWARLLLSKDEDKYKKVNKGDAAMKNRRIVLPALVSVALVFSLIFSASVVGAFRTPASAR